MLSLAKGRVLVCATLAAITASATGCHGLSSQFSETQVGTGALAELSNAGNGVGYSGGTDRGPEKARVKLGLVQVGSSTAQAGEASGVTADAKGNIYLVGVIELQSPPYGTGYIAKFGPNGAQLWGVTLSLSSSVTARGVALGANGDLVVGGDILGGPVPGAVETGSGLYGFFVAGLDPATGATRWMTVVRSEFFAGTRDFRADASGNLYLVGTASTVSPFPVEKSYGTNPGWAALVAKFDPSGTLQWTTAINTGGLTFPQSLAFGPSGSVVISGATLGSLEIPGIPFTQFSPKDGSILPQQVFIAALAQDGTLSWTGQFGSMGSWMTGGSVVCDPASGDIFVSGQTVGLTGGPVIGTHGPDIVLARLSSTGTLKWLEQIGGGNLGFSAPVLSIDAGGALYAASNVGGLYPGAALYGSAVGAFNYAMIMRLTPEGGIAWVTEIGLGPGVLRGYGSTSVATTLFPMPGGGMYVGGIASIPETDGTAPWEFLLFDVDSNGYMN
jgi:hypothetical protein